VNKLFQLFSNEISYAIGWTIIHSLWQCTFIALLIALSYAFTKKAQASTRYWINTLGLVSCVVASGITVYLNFYSSLDITNSDAIIKPSKAAHPVVYVQTISDIINQHIHQIVVCWIIGFGFYIAKYLADFFYCQHIKHHNNELPSETIQHVFNELKNNLGITQAIQLRISKVVNIPCVIGHFIPVVLLPASLILGLSTQQIKVIMLHELGHVSRRDYLISSLQTLITSLYFFNPFARWISSKIDEERENACDDIAVSISGDPLFYAHTLKEFAEMKNNCSTTVAMTGKNNQLINRIKRLFVLDNSFSKTYGKIITIMTLALLGVGFSVSGHSNEEKPDGSFTLKLEKEPLAKLLTLAQEFCPNLSKNISLKHGDQPISGEFARLQCNTVAYFIKGFDNSLNDTLTGIVFNEKNITLKELTQKIELKCPTLQGKIHLNNPTKIVSFETQNLSCLTVEKILMPLDKNNEPGSVRETGIGDMNIDFNNNPDDDYNKIIPISFPNEALDNHYSADCKAHYSVNTEGKAFDVLPVCTNGSDEAKAFFEKQMKISIEKTQFPIKMENEKAVIVLDKEFRSKWTFEDSPEI